MYLCMSEWRGDILRKPQWSCVMRQCLLDLCDLWEREQDLSMGI